MGLEEWEQGAALLGFTSRAQVAAWVRASQRDTAHNARGTRDATLSRLGADSHFRY